MSECTYTSAQLGYTAPFTLVHAAKIQDRLRQIKNTDDTQTKNDPEKAVHLVSWLSIVRGRVVLFCCVLRCLLFLGRV